MDRPIIDHRGPEFAQLTKELLEGMKSIFQTSGRVFIYPSSATGAWEAALVNTLSPGDRILMFDHGFFALNWCRVATRLGLDVDFVPGDWRHAVDPTLIEAKLGEDRKHAYKAVLVVHNETSTGVTSDIARVREAMNDADHPALLMVDTVSSLGSIDYRHDEWSVDVTVSGSQKGLMLPPGLSFHAVSDKALAAGESAALARSYWDWAEMVTFNERGFFPYTPATNLLFGLREAMAMLNEEGLENVFARHDRLAEATRAAVAGWGLEVFCANAADYSSSLTAILTPEGTDADELRRVILERYDMSLGSGLGQLKGKVFRIGHMGDFNDLMLAGTLCGIEMGLRAAEVPHSSGGVAAALDYLGSN
jgi:alanine-glyoxylate transaminase/serine-glyoxylate transaminase/serine-pyruvate transaminase